MKCGSGLPALDAPVLCHQTLRSCPRARCRGSRIFLLLPLNEMEVTNSQYRVDAAAKTYAAAALLAVAIYNAIEMMPIIYFTFSRFSGLYFWSMVTAVTGVLVNATGFGKDNLPLLRSVNSGLAGLTPMPQCVLRELSPYQAWLTLRLTLLCYSVEQLPVDR